MNYLVKLISSLVKEGARELKFERFPGDVQTCEEAMPAGVDFPPIKGQTAIQLETSANGDDVIGGYVNTSQEALPGERRIYAVDESGNIVGYFWMKRDGSMELLGDADNAVRYSGVEDAYNQLKSDHDATVDKLNALIAKWNTFCTNYVPGSPSVAGAPLTLTTSTVSNASHSTGDITPAKIDEIKTP